MSRESVCGRTGYPTRQIFGFGLNCVVGFLLFKAKTLSSNPYMVFGIARYKGKVANLPKLFTASYRHVRTPVG